MERGQAVARDQIGDLENRQDTPEFLVPRATCLFPCFSGQVAMPQQVVHVPRPTKTSSEPICKDRI